MASSFPVSDHCDGERFFNPAKAARVQPFSALLRWWWQRAVLRRFSPWPRRVEDAPAPVLPAAAPAGQLIATFIGHATFLLQTPTRNILTDPVFSERAGPGFGLGPHRVRPPALALADLPRIDLVLLSHNHYDHLDLPALRWLARERRPLIVTTLGNRAWLARRGIERVVELDWWQAHEAPGAPGLAITCTPAQHFAARTPWDRNRTLWGGFALHGPEGRIYFAGDSGFSGAFAQIGARLGPFDLGLIPIGAYEPRWFMTPVHVNPEEAVRVHQAVRARRSVAMHFGTFPLTDEAITEPPRALAAARERHGVAAEDFAVPAAGEVRAVGVE